MINWFDMPTQGLSNGGEFEIKELTATENKVYQKDGEVYNKVTVNVEGGGGSSDFSTAEVTASGIGFFYGAFLVDNKIQYEAKLMNASGVLVLGTNGSIIYMYRGGEVTATSGNIEAVYDDDDLIGYLVTGDCSLTIADPF